MKSTSACPLSTCGFRLGSGSQLAMTASKNWSVSSSFGIGGAEGSGREVFEIQKMMCSMQIISCIADSNSKFLSMGFFKVFVILRINDKGPNQNYCASLKS